MRRLIVSNRLALPVELGFSIDTVIMKMYALTYAVKRKSYDLISFLAPHVLKKLCLKTISCCISNPDRMPAIDCSFNTSMHFHLREIIFKNSKNGSSLQHACAYHAVLRNF